MCTPCVPIQEVNNLKVWQRDNLGHVKTIVVGTEVKDTTLYIRGLRVVELILVLC